MRDLTRSREFREEKVVSKFLRPHNVVFVDPADLVAVTDENHYLYDERVHLPFSEEMVQMNLASAAGADGVPALAAVKENDQLLVVYGRQRRANVIETNRRLEEQGRPRWRVKVTIVSGDALALMAMMISENAGRVEENEITQAKKISRFMTKLGRTLSEAALLIGLSESVAKRRLELLNATPEVQKLLVGKEITERDTVEIAQRPAAEQQKAAEQVVKVRRQNVSKKKRSPWLKRALKVECARIAEDKKTPERFRPICRFVAGKITLEELVDILGVEVKTPEKPKVTAEKPKKTKKASEKKDGELSTGYQPTQQADPNEMARLVALAKKNSEAMLKAETGA